MTCVKPGKQIFVVHPELNQPVKDKKKDNKKYQYPKKSPEQDPADSFHHTSRNNGYCYRFLKLRKMMTGLSYLWVILIFIKTAC